MTLEQSLTRVAGGEPNDDVRHRRVGKSVLRTRTIYSRTLTDRILESLTNSAYKVMWTAVNPIET